MILWHQIEVHRGQAIGDWGGLLDAFEFWLDIFVYVIRWGLMVNLAYMPYQQMSFVTPTSLILWVTTLSNLINLHWLSLLNLWWRYLWLDPPITLFSDRIWMKSLFSNLSLSLSLSPLFGWTFFCSEKRQATHPGFLCSGAVVVELSKYGHSDGSIVGPCTKSWHLATLCCYLPHWDRGKKFRSHMRILCPKFGFSFSQLIAEG
jgi:hypothetical protein